MNRTTIHIHAKVLEGHRIEVLAPQLRVGDEVDVVILAPLHVLPAPGGKSALDIIKELPPGQVFNSAAEIDAHLQKERDSWDA